MIQCLCGGGSSPSSLAAGSLGGAAVVEGVLYGTMMSPERGDRIGEAWGRKFTLRDLWTGELEGQRSTGTVL